MRTAMKCGGFANQNSKKTVQKREISDCRGAALAILCEICYTFR